MSLLGVTIKPTAEGFSGAIEQIRLTSEKDHSGCFVEKGFVEGQGWVLGDQWESG